MKRSAEVVVPAVGDASARDERPDLARMDTTAYDLEATHGRTRVRA
jgi:hypothetical protein